MKHLDMNNPYDAFGVAIIVFVAVLVVGLWKFIKKFLETKKLIEKGEARII